MATARKYKKVSCHATKATAKAAAKKLRSSGMTARLDSSGKCVLSAGKRKKAKTTKRKRA